MIYILETEVLNNKPLIIVLRSIFGIGKLQSLVVCRKLGFSENLTILDLTSDQLSKLIITIENSELLLTNKLKKFNSLLLKQKVNVKSYKGLRHIKGLPVRGQRTHTNAKTAKYFKKKSKYKTCFNWKAISFQNWFKSIVL